MTAAGQSGNSWNQYTMFFTDTTQPGQLNVYKTLTESIKKELPVPSGALFFNSHGSQSITILNSYLYIGTSAYKQHTFGP